MLFGESEVNLTLNIQGANEDFDADELDRLTHSLMRNLEDVGVESITMMRDQDIPVGAKGDPFTLGALLVTVLPAALPKVIEFLQAWAIRNNDQAVKVQIHLKDSSGVERSAELEYPANMSPEELKKQIEVIKPLIEP